MDKISIVVPIYNVEKYLNNCIKSIINQTYKNIEIILINDGSSDNSNFICKEWEKEDPRIIYINQKNQGVSVARNVGLNIATGKYITFVDADDYIENNMIEKLYSGIISNDCNVVVCDYFCSHRKRKKIKHYFDRTKIINVLNNKTELLEKTIQDLGVPWGKLYLRSFLVKNQLCFKVGLKRMQDTIFTLEAFELCTNISYIHIPLYNYRIFEESACNKYSPDFDITAKQVLKYFKSYLTDNSLWEKYKYLYYSKMLILIIEMIKLKFIPSACKLRFKEKETKIINDINSFSLDYNLVSTKILTRNTKIGYYLLKYNFIKLFYIVYKMNYFIEKAKSYK